MFTLGKVDCCRALSVAALPSWVNFIPQWRQKLSVGAISPLHDQH
jgi:hypothetical protein